MKNKLIIKCMDSFDQIDWVMISSKGNIIDKQDNAKLAELYQKVNLDSCKIDILIGCSDLVIKQVTLPKKVNASYLNKMIPNLLEEDLISKVESVHFSCGKIYDSQITIAVVEQNKLENWLKIFNDNQITPDSIYPLCLSLKVKKDEWHIWLEANQCIVRTSAFMGFVVEVDLLPMILNLLYTQENIKPTKILISGKGKDVDLSLHFANYPELLSLFVYSSSALWEAFNYASTSINLLPVSFENRVDPSKRKHFIFQVAMFFCFILCVALGIQIKDIYSYSKIKASQITQIEAIYKSIYPHATSVTSPKLRMERDLKSTKGSDNNTFFTTLYSVGKVLKLNDKVLLKNLSYKNQGLTITIEAINYHEIEKLISDLKSNNLNINQSKTEHQNNKLTAVLTITRK